jgi:hypothetical protein
MTFNADVRCLLLVERMSYVESAEDSRSLVLLFAVVGG